MGWTFYNSSGQLLKSSPGAVTAINNATANELVTIGATTTELCAEAALTFTGTILTVGAAQCSKLIVENNASCYNATLDLKIEASGCGEAVVVFTQGSANGDANNHGYRMGYKGDQPGFRLYTTDADGSSNAGDVLRVVDGTNDVAFVGGVGVGASTAPTAGIDLNNGTLLNVGAAGNDWTANTLSHSSAVASGEKIFYVQNTSADAVSESVIRATVACSANGRVDAIFMAQVSGVQTWTVGVDQSNSDAFMIGQTTPGSNDALRITPATPPVISFNASQGSDFDYVCANCGKHGLEPFECCGVVEWHDDVLALRKATVDLATMTNPYEPGQSLNVAHLVKLGIMNYDSDESPDDLANRITPWLGINISNAQMFTWAGMWQTRELVDGNHACHESRIKELEAKLGGCSG